MKVTITLEDTADGLALSWTEEQSEFQNHGADSLAILSAALWVGGLQRLSEMRLLKLSGEGFLTPS